MDFISIVHMQEKPMNAAPSTESTKSRTTTSNGTKVNTYSEQEVNPESERPMSLFTITVLPTRRIDPPVVN
jgi:hypothetical protein